MEFKSVEHLQGLINSMQYLSMGSQGVCYLVNNFVIKIFHGYDDDDFIVDKDILRFSHIINDTFIWPNDVITLKGKVVGYKTKYIKARNLYTINPLNVNLNKLCECIKDAKKDIKIISNEGVMSYDMMYNTLYGDKFYCIDQDEYSFSSNKNIEKENNKHFDIELYYFLVDNYFNNIVNSNYELKELYESKENVLLFIDLFKKYLSELVGNDVTYLKDAKQYVKKSDKVKYIRQI